MIDVRPTASRDVRALSKRLFGDAPYSPNCWAGWDGDKPVCFATARSHRHGRQWGVYLLRAGVAPRYRGQGLQSRLVQARLGWAAGQGMQWAWTYTAANNAASMRTLIRCGFRPWAPSSFAGRPPGRWVMWRREVGPR